MTIGFRQKMSLLYLFLINIQTANADGLNYQVSRSRFYSVVRIQSGSNPCISNSPSAIIKSITLKQCVYECLRQAGCDDFNVIDGGTDDVDCQLYVNSNPLNYTVKANCRAYQADDKLSTSMIALPADCSFPFTYNGTLYNGCAPEIGRLTANRTATKDCKTDTTHEVISSTLNIGGEAIQVQSIFDWIIWMRRVGDAYSWGLLWNSYKNGFGSVSGGNYWLGLEKVSQLTVTSKYRLRIEIKVLTIGKWRSVEYWSFAVGDESSTKYQLKVDGFSGDTGNTMQFVNQPGCSSDHFPNGMKFSTRDADNDLSGANCASKYGAGWWYSNCGYACPTGNTTVSWWLSMDSTNCGHYLVNEARMMMKPY